MPWENIDLSKASLPLVLVGSLLVAFGVGGIYLGQAIQTQSETQAQLSRLSDTVNKLSNSLSDIRNSFRTWRPEDRWSRTDMIRFCLLVERKNKDFKCPQIDKD